MDPLAFPWRFREFTISADRVDERAGRKGHGPLERSRLFIADDDDTRGGRRLNLTIDRGYAEREHFCRVEIYSFGGVGGGGGGAIYARNPGFVPGCAIYRGFAGSFRFTKSVGTDRSPISGSVSRESALPALARSSIIDIRPQATSPAPV